MQITCSCITRSCLAAYRMSRFVVHCSRWVQVFILGRMGNAQRALHLLMRDLKDVQGAVEFVALQGGNDLWQLLLSLALADPTVTGQCPPRPWPVSVCMCSSCSDF